MFALSVSLAGDEQIISPAPPVAWSSLVTTTTRFPQLNTWSQLPVVFDPSNPTLGAAIPDQWLSRSAARLQVGSESK